MRKQEWVHQLVLLNQIAEVLIVTKMYQKMLEVERKKMEELQE